MKKSYITIVFLLGVVICLSMTKAVLQNMLSTSGIFVSQVEQEINSYKTRNSILSEDLLISSSLTNITQKAQKAGFTNDSVLMILETSRPLAVAR